MNATAVIRLVFQRTRTLRRLYASGTLPMVSRMSRSEAYMASTTNGQCSTMAGGSFSCSGVFMNSCIGGDIAAIFSSRSFSVLAMTNSRPGPA